MKPRDLLLLTLGLGLAAAVTVLVAGGGHPAELQEPEGLPAAAVEEPAADPVAAPVEPAASPLQAPVEDRQDQVVMDTEGWTSGLILGDIQLSTSVLGKIQSISVTVQENRKAGGGGDPAARPYQRTVPVTLGAGTPTFEIRGIPFSPYGYTVRAFSPGLNGTAQTVQINERHPYEEVLLGIMPGVPYSILLRDQDQNPVTNTEVTMAPMGEPPGRPLLKGSTDNFGSLVFEDVLAGPYRVFVGHVEQPMVDPVDVTVQPPGQIRGGRPVRGQFCQIEVPRGVELLVSVVGPTGYGIEGAEIKLLRTDRLRLRVLEGKTDFAGRFTFRHVPPGSYQLDVSKSNYDRRTVSLSFQEGELPPEQVVRITPLR